MNLFNFFKKDSGEIDLNQICFTTKNVVINKLPIVKAFHFSDGNWQFSDKESTNSNANIMLVSLAQILKIDKTVEKTLKMPVSYRADRKENDVNWVMCEFKEENET